MNRDIIIKVLESKKDKLKSFGVKRVGFFGSYLKGTQKRGSDIDLLVTFNKKDFGGDYFNLLFYFENLFNRKIDLIVEKSLRKELDYVKKEAHYVRI